MLDTLEISVERQGLHDITDVIARAVQRLCDGVEHDRLCTLFIQHTSASLLIQENFDSTARDDLENWLNRLVPEDDALFTHTLEGADDMPAHIKSALTSVNLNIPVLRGQLLLGRWQGIFLWEHRHHRGVRQVVVQLT